MINKENNSIMPWKAFVSIALETFIGFYLATFCLAMYFLRIPKHTLILNLFFIGLFLFVTLGSLKRLVQKLSTPALMLVVPIAPLIVLLIVVTLIPILQQL